MYGKWVNLNDDGLYVVSVCASFELQFSLDLCFAKIVILCIWLNYTVRRLTKEYTLDRYTTQTHFVSYVNVRPACRQHHMWNYARIRWDVILRTKTRLAVSGRASGSQRPRIIRDWFRLEEYLFAYTTLCVCVSMCE